MRNSLNSDWLHRLKNTLSANKKALDYLKSRHLASAVFDRFDLGLSIRDRRRSFVNALCFPLRNIRGHLENKYLYINLPEITVFREDCDAHPAWCSGDAQPYFGFVGRDAQIMIWVCNIFDCLAVAQIAHHQPKRFRNYAFACSSHGARSLPNALLDELFESRFHRRLIVYSEAGGEPENAKALSSAWNNTPIFCSSEVGFDSWSKLSSEVPDQLLAAIKKPETVAPQAEWRRLFPSTEKPERLSIGFAYARDRLYLAYLTHREQAQPDGSIAEGEVCVVVTSDGHVLEMRETKQVAGTLVPVLRLTDGTAVEHPPHPLAGCTWSQSAVHEFLEEKNENVLRKHASLHEMLNRLERQIRATVWLPHHEDYQLLAMVVACSYAQELFDAVPLVGLVGDTGTGKTELSQCLAKLGANGCILQTFTEAAFVEAVNAHRGLVVIDDLEKIAPGRGAQSAKFGQLQQLIKMSYKKSTAFYKRCSGTKEDKPLCTYGIKVINNTQGIDPIVANRMFEVSTQLCPDVESWQKSVQDTSLSGGEINELRDELHSWVFRNVAQIRERYISSSQQKSDRAAEILLPLLILAELSGESCWLIALDRVARRRNQQNVESTPDQLVETAVAKIVGQGFRHLSVTHVINEIRLMLNLEINAEHQYEWLNSINIGRILKRRWTANTGSERPFIKFGHRLRAYPIRKIQLNGLATKRQKPDFVIVKQPDEFCRSCLSCSYARSCVLLETHERVTKIPA